MTVAYIDESGNLADKNPFFIVAIVPIEDERLPYRIIKRVRRILGRRKGKVGKELKFTSSSSRLREYLVKRLESENLYCYVFVVDKIERKISDTPENYGAVLNWVLKEGFSVHNWDKVVIDRKFDKERDQKELVEILAKENIRITKVKFADSVSEDGIKLADFVAGFYGQFYNKKAPLPKPLRSIVSEERLSWALIKQTEVAPKGSDGPD